MADPIQMDETERKLIEEHGFIVSLSGHHYVVRDPKNKKLGGRKGRIEGGNLLALLFAALREREGTSPKEDVTNKPATRPAGLRNAKPLPLPPQTETPIPAPSETPARVVEAPTRKPPKRSRNTSVMDALYFAVVDGIEPGKVFNHLTNQGVPLKSASSAYTHASIAKRVMQCVVERGWTPPKASE